MSTSILVIYLAVMSPMGPTLEPVLMRRMESADACAAVVARTPKETPGWAVLCLTDEEARARRAPAGDPARLGVDGPVVADGVRGGSA